jgi:cephalosporin hydroxylase
MPSHNTKLPADLGRGDGTNRDIRFALQMVTKIGQYFVDKPQPELTAEERLLVDQFHDLYYRRWLVDHADTKNLSWFGYLLFKCPLDLWMYQELLVRTKPDFVVETGTFMGGSALYLASILDQLGHGQLITVDVKHPPSLPEHPRVSYLVGSSTDASIVGEVKARVGQARALVILDSDHKESHVYDELHAYHSLVHPGDYLIVEDTNVNGHPTYREHGPGPMEAMDRFLAETDRFEIDHSANRFLMTLNPRGYLKCVG